jgi:hypothetical protein
VNKSNIKRISGVSAIALCLMLIACSGTVARDPLDRTATAEALTPVVPPTVIPIPNTPVPDPVATIAPTLSPTAEPNASTPTVIPEATAIVATPEATVTPESNQPDPTITPEETVVSEPTATTVPVATFGLFLEVVGLSEENIVRGDSLFLTGRVSPDAVMSVNGVFIAVEPDGSFGVNLALKLGPNLIEIVASDLSGATESRVITVISLDEEG